MKGLLFTTAEIIQYDVYVLKVKKCFIFTFVLSLTMLSTYFLNKSFITKIKLKKTNIKFDFAYYTTLLKLKISFTYILRIQTIPQRICSNLENGYVIRIILISQQKLKYRFQEQLSLISLILVRKLGKIKKKDVNKGGNQNNNICLSYDFFV